MTLVSDLRRRKDAPEELQVQRLLCAIYPTRFESWLSDVVTRCYNRNETGIPGFVGDRLDDLKVLSLRFRASRKTRSK
jgi:hypothetical protein